MNTVNAQLTDYRQSPRKVRVVATMVCGKGVDEALSQLTFLGKRASLPIAKLIQSAVANAQAKNIDKTNLFVKELRVDQGKILYRRRSASRGRAPVIRKRTSHVLVVLQEKVLKEKKAKKAKKEAVSVK